MKETLQAEKKKQQPKKKSKLYRKLSPYAPYLWLLPCLILICTFILAPVAETLLLSVSKVSRAGLRKGFNGFENFRYVFSRPEFGRVMFNTIVWDVVIVAVSMVFGLIMALVLNQKFKGRKIVRTVMLLPWATSALVTASCWKYIFDYQYGALNALLLKLGLIETNINFLGNPTSAFICMIIVGIIVTVPFITFTLLSGLQSISNDYYEAAIIDGANFWQRLRHVTLPLLKPAINVSIVLNTIYVFNSFTIVHTITNGAPAHTTGTIMTYLYHMGFKNNNFGASAALSVIGFAILLVFALIYMRTQMKEDD